MERSYGPIPSRDYMGLPQWAKCGPNRFEPSSGVSGHVELTPQSIAVILGNRLQKKAFIIRIEAQNL